MRKGRDTTRLFSVALRKESVDRNCGPQGSGKTLSMSLSARRAWIEIAVLASCALRAAVALRKESVDRNTLSIIILGLRQGRSPQGERG